MFYITSGHSPALKIANLDGTARATILTKDLDDPYDITIDLPAKRIYVGDYSNTYIISCNYDGSNAHIVRSNFGLVSLIVLTKLFLEGVLNTC